MKKSQKIQNIDEKVDYIFNLLEDSKNKGYSNVLKQSQNIVFDNNQNFNNISDTSANIKHHSKTKKKPNQTKKKPKTTFKEKFKKALNKARKFSTSIFPQTEKSHLQKIKADEIDNKTKKIDVDDSKTSKTKNIQAKTNTNTTNLGELGDILNEAKNKDIEFEKQLLDKAKADELKYNKTQNYISELNGKYEKASFFEKGKILSQIAYEKTKLVATKVGDWAVDKTKQASHIIEMGKSFLANITNKIENLKTLLPKHITKFYKSFRLQGKVAQSILKKIPLIGSVLSLVFGTIDLAKAKTNKDVREIFGEALGSSIGGIIGFAVGSLLTPIVGAVVSIITSFIGEYVGKQLSYYGIEPIDFIPFDCYDLPLEAKIEILQESMKQSEIPPIFYNKEIFEAALSKGEGLENQDKPNIFQTAANIANTGVETLTGIDIDDDGEVNTIIKNENQSKTSINPEAVQGSVIQVNRTYKGKDFKGRDFVGGTISIVDGNKNILFSAATIERGEEGLQSGKNLRIPPGTYNLTWHYGSKHSDVPKVYNDSIPQSRAILLHKGWSVSWTAGCVVFAQPQQPKIGKNNQATFQSDERKFVKVLKEFLYQSGTIKPKGDLPIKLQVFNNFKEENSVSPRRAKKKEIEQQQEIVNNKILVIVD